ncbi:TPA: cell filamentation protein Fic, partial [Enterococcus faecium]
NDLEISHLLSQALAEQIHDRQLFMKGIDVSYFYEGYSEYTIDDL